MVEEYLKRKSWLDVLFELTIIKDLDKKKL